MILTTRLKPTYSLWFLLIGIIITKTGKVSAHAPPRAMYYGHRVEPREPLQHIPSSLYYGSTSRDRLYDMPSCSQLRYMWKSSIKDFMDNNINENLDNNEIPMILNNPYYTTLLWRQQKPNFGKIVIEPKVSSKESNQNRVEVRFQGKSSSQDSPKDVTPIPGHFMDKPSQIGVVYGHVIHSPEEAQGRHQISTTDDKNRKSTENGVFGDFVTQVDDSDESKGRSTEINNHNNHQNSIKQQRTGSSSFKSAEDFFKSGIWHNKPVIPSVSFQRYH